MTKGQGADGLTHVFSAAIFSGHEICPKSPKLLDGLVPVIPVVVEMLTDTGPSG